MEILKPCTTNDGQYYSCQLRIHDDIILLLNT